MKNRGIRAMGCFGVIVAMGAAIASTGFAHAVIAPPRETAQAQSAQQGSQGAQAQGNAARTLGTVEAISGNNITLKTQGGDIAVTVADGASVVRVEPDAKDLKNAVPLQLTDILVGDRILVFGHASDDHKSIAAAKVIAMKKADLDAKHQQDTAAWQQHGVGGLVSAVDPATGTVTITVTSLGGTKPLLIQTAKTTIFRRYAPDSIQFDDAKASAFADVKVGDQLRARGARSADGATLAADEIVSGSFRNISGTIDAVDTAANTMTVTDLATKQPVTVKITSGSQVRKLPQMFAQGIAMRLKGGAAGANGQAGGQGNGQGAAQGAGAQGNGQGAMGGQSQGGQAGQGGVGGAARRSGGSGGAGDFQSMINRMPPASLTDFQKGDAVMIVSTNGTSADTATAITVLGGVEPILAATPKGGQPMTLSPWSLGGGGGEGAGGDAGGVQ
jgi:hypothetical protein